MKRAHLLLAIVFIAFTACGLSANSLTFLENINIRNSGAADSLTPFTNDSFSAFCSPAGYARLEKAQIGLVYYPSFENSSLSAVAFAYPLVDAGAIAVSGVMLSSVDIEERDSGNVVTGTYNDNYMAVFLSYGLNISGIADAGLSVKYLSHKFYTGVDSSAIGLDAGVSADLPFGIRASAIVTNILKPVFYYDSGESDPLPVKGTFAASRSIKFMENNNDRLIAGAQISVSEFENSPVFGAGAEYMLFNTAALRAGYSTEGLTAGASFYLAGGELNYALVQTPYDYINRFSISYSFGENVREIEKNASLKDARLKEELIKTIKADTINKYTADLENQIKNKDFTSAKETAVKALVWDPENSWFSQRLEELNKIESGARLAQFIKEAVDMVELGLYIDAMVSLNSALEIDPANQEAKSLYKRAEQMAVTLGENNLSVENANKAQIQMHFNNGLNLYASGNYAGALKEWDQVIKDSPMQRQVYTYIQSAQKRLKAIETSEQKQKSEREKKLAGLYNRAVLLYTKGQLEDSLAAWKELLAADPENSEAASNIERLATELNKARQQQLNW